VLPVLAPLLGVACFNDHESAVTLEPSVHATLLPVTTTALLRHLVSANALLVFVCMLVHDVHTLLDPPEPPILLPADSTVQPLPTTVTSVPPVDAAFVRTVLDAAGTMSTLPAFINVDCAIGNTDTTLSSFVLVAHALTLFTITDDDDVHNVACAPVPPLRHAIVDELLLLLPPPPTTVTDMLPVLPVFVGDIDCRDESDVNARVIDDSRPPP
jgi:hypothetical protein